MINLARCVKFVILLQSSLDVLAFSTTPTNARSQSASAAFQKDNAKEIDVAIIGAGPGGLVLAHSLIDRGYSVQVLERRSSFRPVGAAVFLHPFAIKSLKALSTKVADNLLEAATQVGTVTVKSITAQKNNAIFDKFDEAPDVLGAPFVAVKFWDMLKALKQGLPEDIFSFGIDVQGYQELENGRVQLSCSRVTSDGKDYPSVGMLEAGMVVDVGGIRSNIRKQILPDSSSVPLCKAYMSVVPAANADAIMNQKDTLVERELCFLQGDADGGILARLENGDVWWTYNYFENSLNESLTKEQLIKRVEDRFPAYFPKLIAATDNIVETVVADFPVRWKWGEGKVTLLGDAAHAQLPSLGLGCSAAFADIEEFCRQIDENGLSSQALRGYERNRMPWTAMQQIASRFTAKGFEVLGSQK